MLPINKDSCGCRGRGHGALQGRVETTCFYPFVSVSPARNGWSNYGRSPGKCSGSCISVYHINKYRTTPGLRSCRIANTRRIPILDVSSPLGFRNPFAFRSTVREPLFSSSSSPPVHPSTLPKYPLGLPFLYLHVSFSYRLFCFLHFGLSLRS